MGVRRGVHTDARIGWLLVFIAAIAAPPTASAIEANGGARILYVEPFRAVAVETDANARASQKSSSDELQRLRFTAYGKQFDLSLGSNAKLTQLQAQLQSKTDPSSLQLYRGQIDGVPGSWVRLAIKPIDADTNEVHGMLWDGTDLYVVEPADQIFDALVPPADTTADTVIFRLADVLMDPAATACGTDTSAGPRKGTDAFGSLVQELKGTPAIMQSVGASRRLELSVLGDSLFLQQHSNAQQAREQILLRLNNVDGIFSSQLGVEIQVPSIDISDAQSDPLSATTSSSSLLSELAELRRRTADLRSRGLTHLFTGRDLDGTTVGIAYLDSLCDQKFGVGLTEINYRGSWIESLITAHEIGHNFGAVHDGEPSDSCASTPTGLYLMSPSVNGHDAFSQCSLNVIQPKADTAFCIADLPPADVAIAAELGTAHESVTRPFEWNLTVTNVGGSNAQNVRAEILVPPVVVVEDAYVTGGSCTSGAGVIQCQLGNLQGSVSRDVHLTLRSDVTGSSSISARVSAQNEIHLGNNNGSGTLAIEPEADLALTLQAPATAAISEVFDLNFSVVNRAAVQATQIDVTIDLPQGMSATNAVLGGVGCTVTEANVQCALASLAPGATVSGRISLSSLSAGNRTLKARVSGSYVDPDASNDAAEHVVNITGAESSTVLSSSEKSGGGGGSTGSLFLLSLAALQFARRRLHTTRTLP